jgi:hypothetical protein
VHRLNDTLEPFYNISTNTIVANFPTTLQQLMALNSATLNPILEVLELDTLGTLNEKKQRLRAHIGVSLSD